MSEGRIELTLRWEGTRCVAVEVRSRRQLGLWRSLEGRPVDESLRLAPLLSSICSTAHGVAAVRAVEHALQVPVDAEQERLRTALVEAETLQNHLWFWTMTAPGLLGEPARVPLARETRTAQAGLTRAFGLDGAASTVGGVPFSPSRAGVDDALARLRRQLDELGLRVPNDLSALHALPSTAGQLFRALGTGHNTLGRAPRLGLPTAEWVELNVARSPAFQAEPVLDDGPVDVGTLSATRTHPLVRHATETWGPGVGARFVARLVETCASFERLERFTQELRGGGGRPVERAVAGVGLGEAPTSRGPLFHHVSLERGHVLTWRVVAPTEWTFHPRGAVRDALLGLSAPDVHTGQQLAAWVVASLDPCVECAVHVGGA